MRNSSSLKANHDKSQRQTWMKQKHRTTWGSINQENESTAKYEKAAGGSKSYRDTCCNKTSFYKRLVHSSFMNSRLASLKVPERTWSQQGDVTWILLKQIIFTKPAIQSALNSWNLPNGFYSSTELLFVHNKWSKSKTKINSKNQHAQSVWFWQQC